MAQRLTHLDEQGAARMVDIASKTPSARLARARGRIAMNKVALDAIREGNAPKGDVLSTARIAAIMAAKRTSELIPLCHPLALSRVDIDFEFVAGGIEATASVTLEGKTGAEMEALCAASVALLTIYDMAKALDKAMVIEQVHLVEKRGGKSGDFTAPMSSCPSSI